MIRMPVGRIISIIMQTRPVTLDKRPRLTPPEATLQPGIKRSKRKKYTQPDFGSSEDVISRHVVELLGTQVVARAEADGIEWQSPFGFREEVEVTVSSISSSGMSCFNVCVDPCLSTPVSPFSYPVWSFTKAYSNRRRTCPCPVVGASMGRRRPLRATRRGRSCPRL